ncbi:MAG TPA: 2TM domain-containing protein [Polyangia bacterium]
MERNEEELRQLARKRVENRQGFFIHSLLFVAVNLALYGIWRLTGAGYPWFLWPLFGWGIGIVGHALSLWLGPGSASEQRALDRELRRLHGSRP